MPTRVRSICASSWQQVGSICGWVGSICANSWQRFGSICVSGLSMLTCGSESGLSVAGSGPSVRTCGSELGLSVGRVYLSVAGSGLTAPTCGSGSGLSEGPVYPVNLCSGSGLSVTGSGLSVYLCQPVATGQVHLRVGFICANPWQRVGSICGRVGSICATLWQPAGSICGSSLSMPTRGNNLIVKCCREVEELEGPNQLLPARHHARHERQQAQTPQTASQRVQTRRPSSETPESNATRRVSLCHKPFHSSARNRSRPTTRGRPVLCPSELRIPFHRLGREEDENN